MVDEQIEWNKKRVSVEGLGFRGRVWWTSRSSGTRRRLGPLSQEAETEAQTLNPKPQTRNPNRRRRRGSSRRPRPRHKP